MPRSARIVSRSTSSATSRTAWRERNFSSPATLIKKGFDLRLVGIELERARQKLQTFLIFFVSKVSDSQGRHNPRRIWRQLMRRLKGLNRFFRLAAKRDSENLGSSREKKKRLAPATRALATDFRPRHLSEYPDTRTAGLSLHTHPPGGRHSLTALPCLLEFCYPHQDSIGLHSPFPVGKFRADRGRTRMNFPILTSQPPCPGCLSFATLTTTHSDCTAPFWWGKFADRRSGAYEFSYPY